MTSDRSFDWLPPSPTAEQFAEGRRLLWEGMTFPQMRLRLVSFGASHEVSAIAMTELAREFAERLLVLRRPEEKIRQQLVERGLDPREATTAIAGARRAHDKRLYRAGIANSRFLLAGFLVFFLGVLIALASELQLLNLGVRAGSLILLISLFFAVYGYWRSRQPVKNSPRMERAN